MLLRFFAHALRQWVPIVAPGVAGFVLFLAPAVGCSHVGTDGAGGTGASSGAGGAHSGGTGGATGGTRGSAMAPCNGHISSVLTGFYGPAPWVQPANLNSTNCAYPPSQNVQATCAVVTAVDTWDARAPEHGRFPGRVAARRRRHGRRVGSPPPCPFPQEKPLFRHHSVDPPDGYVEPALGRGAHPGRGESLGRSASRGIA
jgi:hypothetical protein